MKLLRTFETAARRFDPIRAFCVCVINCSRVVTPAKPQLFQQLEILSRLDRNTTHVDIPKLAAHWPRKARISQWKQDGSVSHFRLPGETTRRECNPISYLHDVKGIHLPCGMNGKTILFITSYPSSIVICGSTLRRKRKHETQTHNVDWRRTNRI